MQYFFKVVLMLLVATLSFYSAVPAFAQTIDPATPEAVDSEDFTLVPPDCTGPDAATECDFEDMMQLIANIMGFLMVAALLLATLLFAVAGFRYATASGNPGQIESAKKIFLNVVIGLAIVFGAYLIVQVVVSTLGVVNSNEDGEGEFNQFLEEY